MLTSICQGGGADLKTIRTPSLASTGRDGRLDQLSYHPRLDSRL